MDFSTIYRVQPDRRSPGPQQQKSDGDRFGVLEKTEEEAYGLLGSATLSGLESFRRTKTTT